MLELHLDDRERPRVLARLGRAPLLIGRDQNNDVVLSDDGIGARHCRVWLDADEIVHVRDLGSRGGSWVNEERVGRERRARPGDQIRLGPRVVLRLIEPAPHPGVTLQDAVARWLPTLAAARDQPAVLTALTAATSEVVGPERVQVCSGDPATFALGSFGGLLVDGALDPAQAALLGALCSLAAPFLDREDPPETRRGDLGKATLAFQLRRIEEERARCKGNLAETARRLGVNRQYLYRLMARGRSV